MSTHPINTIPNVRVRTHAKPEVSHRHSSCWPTFGGIVLLIGAVIGGCARDEVSTPAPAATAPAVSERYVGCIGSTADPNTFVLSVAEGRDFTTGEPPGTPIPQKSELPEGAPPPNPPVTVTSGTPGGGPKPGTKIVTYQLVGDGGKNLGEHLGDTVEVLGTHQPPTDDSSTSRTSAGTLSVTSLRVLADYCK